MKHKIYTRYIPGIYQFYDFQVNRPTVYVDDSHIRSLTWPGTQVFGLRTPEIDHDFVIATQDGELPSKLPTADLCLKLGADPTIKNNDGKTAGELFARIAGMPEVLLGIGLIATEG